MWQQIRLLDTLALIFGIRPTRTSRVSGKKYSPIGIILALVHIYCVFTFDYKNEMDRRVFILLLGKINPIMFGMFKMNRLANVAIPLFIIFGRIVHFRFYQKMLDTRDCFDDYLTKNHVKVHSIRRKEIVIDVVGFLIVMFVIGLNCWSQVKYAQAQYRKPSNFYELYFITVIRGDMMITFMSICNCYYGIFVRIVEFIKILKQNQLKMINRIF